MPDERGEIRGRFVTFRHPFRGRADRGIRRVTGRAIRAFTNGTADLAPSAVWHASADGLCHLGRKRPGRLGSLACAAVCAHQRCTRRKQAGLEKDMNGFKNFLIRGNLIDLAVAVVIGVAFNAIVQALVGGMITPLIGIFTHHVGNFAGLSFSVHGSKFLYGSVVNAAVSFLVIAAVVYYLIVAPANRLTALATRRKAAADRQCPECLSQIPVGARRCMYCTSEVPPVAATDVPAPRRARHGYFAPDPGTGSDLGS